MATARYVILGEDLTGVRFTEQLLKRTGVDLREVRSLLAPPGQGSGKQWVTSQYPDQVLAHRAKAAHAWKALIVATDADEQSVAERQRVLDEALPAAGLDRRGPAERIVLLVPRWEFEPWAEHLIRGTAVSEDRKAGWTTQRAQKEGHQAGGLLPVHRPRGGELPPCCPPSLVASDGELARLGE